MIKRNPVAAARMDSGVTTYHPVLCALAEFDMAAGLRVSSKDSSLIVGDIFGLDIF